MSDIWYYYIQNDGESTWHQLCTQDEISNNLANHYYMWANNPDMNEQDRVIFRYNLGLCYYHGTDTTKSLLKAMHCFALIAKNYPRAAIMLGDCYVKGGEGLEPNKERAADWYWQVGTQSEDSELVRLAAAKMLEVEKYDHAFELYKKAAKPNDLLSIAYLLYFCEMFSAEVTQATAKTFREQLPLEYRELPATELLTSLIQSKQGALKSAS